MVIEDGAVVVSSILGTNAVVRSCAKISRGCILAGNTVIGRGVTLPEFTRVKALVRLVRLDRH